MPTLIPIALALILGGTPAKKVYVDSTLNLKFTHPAQWTLKNERAKTTLRVPLKDKKSFATIVITDLGFFESIDKWTEYQADAAKSAGHAVTRQWQEDLMGVPILMTQVRYQDKKSDVTSLSGLLYSRTDRKMYFRVIAPSDEYDAVAADWRSVLETLATIDGTELKIEEAGRVPIKNPKAKPEKGPRKAVSVPLDNPTFKPTKTIVIKPEDLPVPVKAPADSIALTATAGGAEVTFYVPNMWRATWTKDHWTLTHPQLSGSLYLEPASELDSPSAEMRMEQLGATLQESLKTTTKRADSRPHTGKSGLEIRDFSRTGQAASGPAFQLIFSGRKKDVYLVGTYAAADTPGAMTSAKRLIDDLLNRIVVIPKP